MNRNMSRRFADWTGSDRKCTEAGHDEPTVITSARSPTGPTQRVARARPVERDKDNFFHVPESVVTIGHPRLPRKCSARDFRIRIGRCSQSPPAAVLPLLGDHSRIRGESRAFGVGWTPPVQDFRAFVGLDGVWELLAVDRADVGSSQSAGGERRGDGGSQRPVRLVEATSRCLWWTSRRTHRTLVRSSRVEQERRGAVRGELRPFQPRVKADKSTPASEFGWSGQREVARKALVHTARRKDGCSQAPRDGRRPTGRRGRDRADGRRTAPGQTPARVRMIVARGEWELPRWR